MIKVVWDEAFKRKYKKLSKNNETFKSNFWEKMELFIENPHNPVLKTHKLTGKLKDSYSSVIDYDCRIVFQFTYDNNILLIDLGSHDEVY